MRKISELSVRAQILVQNAKERMAAAVRSQRGGISDYIAMLIIVAIVLLIGWAIWNYLFRNENVIANWFKGNVDKIIKCTNDTIGNEVSGGGGVNPNC